MSNERGFAKAENSFLGKTTNARRLTKTSRAIEAVTKMNTVEFFSRMMDDNLEKQLWIMFMTGMAPKLDERGYPIMEEGKPIMVPIEVNPTSYRAFQRCVEYKRGTPIVTVKQEDPNKRENVIEISIIGATPEYFEKAAKERGFLVKS